MEKLLQNSLALLGLTSKEIKFFITCFTIGPASISDLQKSARLERSTAYLIAEDLIKRGLIQEDFKNYKKLLHTIEPKDILRMVSAKQRVLGRNALELEENISELNALYQASEIRPKVRVFQGVRGLMSVQEDILNAKSEIYLWTNQETEHNFFTDSFHHKFIETRIKRNIPIKVLAVNNAAGKRLQSLDKNSLRQTKLLSEQTIFSPETYIYDNKIATLDYKKDIIGVITESEPMATSQKAIFQLAWDSLK